MTDKEATDPKISYPGFAGLKYPSNSTFNQQQQQPWVPNAQHMAMFMEAVTVFKYFD